MKLFALHSIIVTSFLLLFLTCGEEKIVINNIADFEEYIQDEIDIQSIPALSVLIFKEDNILYEDYLGQSHIEQNIALESDHLFLLASISKVITATALLQLNDQELFDLDDNINDFLPFDVNIPNQNTAITFRMLLTHTSAINDGSALDNQYYYGEDSPVQLAYFLENYLVSGGEFYNASENFHNFDPGSKHEYSNIGNALIGLLVQEISGIDFSDYCKQNIFTPLGMTNTYWHLSEISQTIVQPYNYNFSSRKNEKVEHYTFTDYPNGGLRSTSIDLFKFLKAFVQDGQSNSQQLLQPETINAMITPQIPGIDNEVGLHLFLMNTSNNLWGHDGGEDGVATIMAFNPITKIGVIILSNQGEADLDDMLLETYKFGLKL